MNREDFHSQDVYVGDRAALLIYGQIPNDSPDWLDHAQSLTTFRPACINNTSASLLLLRLTDSADHAYGLTWGMGHLVISSHVIDDGFGLRFALRRADAEQISALTTHALDTLPRTARLSVFGGTAINSFGMEEIGEVVSRLAGKIPATGLSSDRPDSPTFITVKGADALSVPIGKTSSNALSDLALIDSVIRNEAPADGLEHLENTRPLRPGHPKIEVLEQRFNEVVADLATGRLTLSWPAEWNEDAGEPAKYRITGLRGGNFESNDLELGDLIDPLAEIADPDKLERLRRLHVQGLADGGGAMSRKISGDKWVAFECDLDSERFVMQRGRWYNVGGAYIKMLDDKVDRILQKTSSISLPRWPQEWKKKRNSSKYILGRATERTYNEWVAETNPELLCMDRKLVKTELHPGGFEACDLLHSDGTLIHVKHLDDSVSASHLFNQVIVAVESLRRQPDAFTRFAAKVDEISDGKFIIEADYRPPRAVLAFSGGGAIKDSIFTFSKIALARCSQRLGDLDVPLEIIRLAGSDAVIGQHPPQV